MNHMTWLQTDYLLVLQHFRECTCGVFDEFFLNITLFGEVFIPLAVICFFYWCFDKKTGFFILSSYLYCFLINTFIKTTACIYRPWILEPNIKPVSQAIAAATGYSFPSGHTAGATAVFGGIALSFSKNKMIFYACLCIIFLVMFSRNYLGVHTPQDVVAAFIISWIILLINKKIFERSNKYIDLTIVVITTVLSIFLALYVNYKSYPLDYLNGQILYNPNPVKTEIVTRVGFVLGAFWGWFIENRFIKFSPQTGSFFKKSLRYVTGILSLLIIACLCKLLTSNFLSVKIGMFLEYFILASFITCLYPLLLKKLNA